MFGFTRIRVLLPPYILTKCRHFSKAAAEEKVIRLQYLISILSIYFTFYFYVLSVAAVLFKFPYVSFVAPRGVPIPGSPRGPTFDEKREWGIVTFGME